MNFKKTETPMLNTALNILRSNREALTAEAHCDGPCGVYDPSSVRIAAEAAVSMTKKILSLTPPEADDAAGMAAYLNTMSRYVAIKEEQAHLAKSELLVLWTDFFKSIILSSTQIFTPILESSEAVLCRKGRGFSCACTRAMDVRLRRSTTFSGRLKVAKFLGTPRAKLIQSVIHVAALH